MPETGDYAKIGLVVCLGVLGTIINLVFGIWPIVISRSHADDPGEVNGCKVGSIRTTLLVLGILHLLILIPTWLKICFSSLGTVLKGDDEKSPLAPFESLSTTIQSCCSCGVLAVTIAASVFVFSSACRSEDPPIHGPGSTFMIVYWAVGAVSCILIACCAAIVSVIVIGWQAKNI
eukprot:gb/GECH01006671.1/.p1 GENE.gb/GECH01006671.1/~~gb/GECH01006671.1/.p1  ORF type:complete len:176 (+),score=32.17 gb/GECH01006671.1/:1-528(+)